MKKVSMPVDLERDMWKQRTKALVMLLCEALDRLDGKLHKAEDVAEWIAEIIDEGWIAEVKSMPHLRPSRLMEIDEAIEKGAINDAVAYK